MQKVFISFFFNLNWLCISHWGWSFIPHSCCIPKQVLGDIVQFLFFISCTPRSSSTFSHFHYLKIEWVVIIKFRLPHLQSFLVILPYNDDLKGSFLPNIPLKMADNHGKNDKNDNDNDKMSWFSWLFMITIMSKRLGIFLSDLITSVCDL